MAGLGGGARLPCKSLGSRIGVLVCHPVLGELAHRAAWKKQNNSLEFLATEVCPNKIQNVFDFEY